MAKGGVDAAVRKEMEARGDVEALAREEFVRERLALAGGVARGEKVQRAATELRRIWEEACCCMARSVSRIDEKLGRRD